MASAAQSDHATSPAVAEQIALDREQRRVERQALMSMSSSDLAEVPQRQTFLPQNMAELVKFSDLMAASNFVPKHLRGRSGDCLAVAMQAMRWGMDPFAVANKTYFVNDGAPPAFEAQLVAAVVNGSSALSGRLRYQWEGDGDKLRCTVTGFLRADLSDPKIRTVHIARITTKNSPLWKQDPEQQLGYYATRAWARLYAPDVLMGVYTPDELAVDPERARVVSAPMPRRTALVDEIVQRGDIAAHDPVTGELDDDAIDVVAEHSRTDPIDRRAEPSVDEQMNAFSAQVEEHVGRMTDALKVIQTRDALPSSLTDEARTYLIGICDRKIGELRTQKAKKA